MARVGVRARLIALFGLLLTLLVLVSGQMWSLLAADQARGQRYSAMLAGLERNRSAYAILSRYRKLASDIATNAVLRGSGAVDPRQLEALRQTAAEIRQALGELTNAEQAAAVWVELDAVEANLRMLLQVLQAGDAPATDAAVQAMRTAFFSVEARLLEVIHGSQQQVVDSTREDARRRAANLQSGLVMIAAIVSAMLLVGWMLRSLLRRLNETTQAIRAVNEGRAQVALPDVADDELGEMASALRQLRVSTEQLNFLVYHDALTSLPSRAGFDRALTETLHQAPVGGGVAVLLAGLDRFRAINDAFGHSLGDRYLRESGERLAALLGGRHFVARHSGDVFACLLRLDGAADPEAQARALAERLRRGMYTPLALDGQELGVSVSIGAALYPRDGASAEALIGAADAALHVAKRGGRNALHFAEGGASERLRDTLKLASDIRRGIEQDEFEPHYQPMLDARSGAVVAVEALVRWRHPQRGVLLPRDFLSVAEDAGLFADIARGVLSQACARLAQWQAAGFGFRLAVNLSPQELRQELVTRVGEVLRAHALAPQTLELEITESAMLERPDQADRLLRELRSMGVAISLDDFGTGYSSLSYLHQFPIDRIKIDRSFVAQMESSPRAERIVATMVRMAAGLELDVVAEGVETAAQARKLRLMGCWLQQGFHYMPALAAGELQEWLAQRQSADAQVQAN